MKFRYLPIFFICLAVPYSLSAEPNAVAPAPVNKASMEEAGFGSIATLLGEMSPEQRTEVMRQAAEKEKELQAMSPAEREALTAQMRAILATLDVGKVEPTKLDPAHAGTVQQTRQSFDQYQKKYRAGQINSPVVMQGK